MANKIYISPGVYTNEQDLTFVAQNIGLTKLGLVGETLSGPAFEPIMISNFDDFKTYFGGVSNEKFDDKRLKYELAYNAKSFLSEANELYVTRVLGLTGYRPNISFGLKTLPGIDVTKTNGVINAPTAVSDVETFPQANFSGSTFFSELSTKIISNGLTVNEFLTTTDFNDGDYFTIGYVNPQDIVGGQAHPQSPIVGEGPEWYNVFFGTTGSTVHVFSYYFSIGVTTGGTNVNIIRYRYAATLNETYNNTVVATFRSRGKYQNETLTFKVPTSSGTTVTSTTLTSNPLSDMTLTTGGKTFTVNLNESSNKYIKKVLGFQPFDKNEDEFPVYVHEVYPNLVKNLYHQGFIRGLSLTLLSQNNNNEFRTSWKTASSPTVVSEVRGGKVNNLFDIVAISDGDKSNTEIKISIEKIDLNSGEFDLVVRDFFDTDDNPKVLEKFTRCSMNPDSVGYIGKRIGTTDGQWMSRSKKIMVHIHEDAPIDAIPAGFRGYPTRANFGGSGNKLGNLLYKTKYFDAGDIMYYSNGTPIISGTGDRVRKSYLGLSTQEGFKYDIDMFNFKGTNTTDVSYGFHMSLNASTISEGNFMTTPYELEGENKGKLEDINFRKFTFALAGGFDGWDIYRRRRTNTDNYILGKNIYTQNVNTGVFSNSTPNSDYYAYLQGYLTMANPEAIDINVLATPSIDFYNHSSLVSQVIDMVENDRRDCLYVVNSPNQDTVDEVVDLLDIVGFDTSYAATYFPYIQINDTDNGSIETISPTSEVLRNIALTDNKSYPWIPVAGYGKGLVRSKKAKFVLTERERDTLYQSRINPIASFTDSGTVIFGNKTLQVRESALDRINVRRLLLRTRKLISVAAKRLLFEPNDETVREEFLRMVNPILEAIRKERGLLEFRVVVSNNPEDLDSNTLQGKIYLRPTRALEFIDIGFVLSNSGASFDDV